jgi:hypothetical protein
MHEQQPNTGMYEHNEEDKIWDEKIVRDAILTTFIQAMAQT